MRSRASTVLMWVCLGGFLYVLAVGPAKRAALGTSASEIVDLVWCPIVALDSTAVQPLYRGYLGLWGIHYPPPVGF